MHSKTKVGFGLILTLLLAVLMVSPVWAVEIKSGDMLTIGEGKTNGPLFLSGNYVTVNGDVDGDVFVAGQSVTINGKIDGDLIAGAQSITVKGIVNGDVRGAANQIDIQGQVTGSVTAAANNIEVRDQAVIGRDVLGFGNSFGTSGRIDGQLMGSAAEVRINGMVNGAVTLWNVQTLSVGPAAIVKGAISYGSPKQANISPQAQINAISWQEKAADIPQKKKTTPGFSWLNALGWIAAGLLLWVICYWISPRLLPNMGEIVLNKPGSTLGWGFLVLLLTPLAGLVLAITIIGIPLAIIMLFLYVFVLFTSKILAGDVIGRYLARYFGWENRMPFFFPFIIAFLALIVLSKVPVVGFLVSLTASCLALGMVVMYFYNWRSKKPDSVGQTEPQSPENKQEPGPDIEPA